MVAPTGTNIVNPLQHVNGLLPLGRSTETMPPKMSLTALQTKAYAGLFSNLNVKLECLIPPPTTIDFILGADTCTLSPTSAPPMDYGQGLLYD
jgi:hypothetical protein